MAWCSVKIKHKNSFTFTFTLLYFTLLYLKVKMNSLFTGSKNALQKLQK